MELVKTCRQDKITCRKNEHYKLITIPRLPRTTSYTCNFLSVQNFGHLAFCSKAS